MKVLYLDVKNGQPLVETEIADDNINEYYRLLDCDCFDIVYRNRYGHKFCVICDDCGALDEDRKMSIWFSPFDAIFGNVVITGPSDREGNLTDVDPGLYEKLLKISQVQLDDYYVLFCKK